MIIKIFKFWVLYLDNLKTASLPPHIHKFHADVIDFEIISEHDLTNSKSYWSLFEPTHCADTGYSGIMKVIFVSEQGCAVI